jgi:DNA-binding winged helix-turn-helix (wHTH) protein
MRVSFGGYSLDVATRQLLQGKTEVRLSPKAFDLLCVLIDNRKRALSKAELHDQLWLGTYVTDAALSVLVAELRHALHDRAGAPRFIRTVRGFGYAFCGHVSETVDTAPTPRNCWVVLGQREIALHEGDNIIGRDPGVTVRLDLPSVSRRHARIVVSAHTATVEDRGSKNGTFVRKDRITRAVRLADLDEVQVGSARLLVRMLGGDAATQTLADT